MVREHPGQQRMVRQPLLDDRQGAPVERLGLAFAAGLAEQKGEVVQGLRDVGVLSAKASLPDVQDLPQERLGLGLPTGGEMKQGQVVEEI